MSHRRTGRVAPGYGADGGGTPGGVPVVLFRMGSMVRTPRVPEQAGTAIVLERPGSPKVLGGTRDSQ